MCKHGVCILSGLLLVFFCGYAAADKVVLLDDDPSFCTIFEHLNAGDVPDECPKKPKKRGGPREPVAVGFNRLIMFAFDSSVLSEKSRVVLDTLLQVLNDKKMRHKPIRVEGHTDSVGTAVYNQRLSEQRALAVKGYLLRHGISPGRIETVGWGYTRLYDAQHPEDEINRRVQFVNLGE